MGNPGVGNWLPYKDDEVSSLLQCVWRFAEFSELEQKFICCLLYC